METLILSIISRGYDLKFTHNYVDKTITIDATPNRPGMGASSTIDEKANWHDALKAIEKRLFY